MTFSRTAKGLLLGIGAVTMVAAAPPAGTNWNAAMRATDTGHEVGNPDADVKLTKWISYTCSACATFEIQADGAMRLAYILPGKLRVEVRHLIRDPIDLTVATLARCGAEDRFFMNHAAFMHRQPEWLGKARDATDGQVARWNALRGAAQRRALAEALDLYDIMETRGYSRSEANQCLNDEAEAAALRASTEADSAAFQLEYTPSFAFDETGPAEPNNWAGLQPLIAERLELAASPE